MNLETEVKFHVPALSALRQRLTALGAQLTKPIIFERNVRYDTADDRLQKERALIRLRQDREVIITYKGVPHGIDISASEVRVREEIEMVVSDFEAADLILQRLGFQPRQRYEKYRETWISGECEIVLDEMPFGNFVEIEGDEEAIKVIAIALNLDWEKRINSNYLSLLVQFNEQFGTAIHDLTFANFQQYDVSTAIFDGELKAES